MTAALRALIATALCLTLLGSEADEPQMSAEFRGVGIFPGEMEISSGSRFRVEFRMRLESKLLVGELVRLKSGTKWTIVNGHVHDDTLTFDIGDPLTQCVLVFKPETGEFVGDCCRGDQGVCPITLSLTPWGESTAQPDSIAE